jgi:hypothetical protein
VSLSPARPQTTSAARRRRSAETGGIGESSRRGTVMPERLPRVRELTPATSVASRAGNAVLRPKYPGVHTGAAEEDHPSTAYLVLTLKLSEEATDVPVIDVILAVRTAAVGLAASRGELPGLDDVERAARRHLGMAG